jgi:hypothetical protein
LQLPGLLVRDEAQRVNDALRFHILITGPRR